MTSSIATLIVIMIAAASALAFAHGINGTQRRSARAVKVPRSRRAAAARNGIRRNHRV